MLVPHYFDAEVPLCTLQVMLDLDYLVPKTSSADNYLQEAFQCMFRNNFYSMYVFTNKEETGLDAYLRHSRQVPKDSYYHYKLHGVQL